MVNACVSPLGVLMSKVAPTPGSIGGPEIEIDRVAEILLRVALQNPNFATIRECRFRQYPIAARQNAEDLEGGSDHEQREENRDQEFLHFLLRGFVRC